MLCSLANLDKEKLAAIQGYEQKTGKTVLAFACRDVGIAELNEKETGELKELENRLGLSLVAYRQT